MKIEWSKSKPVSVVLFIYLCRYMLLIQYKKRIPWILELLYQYL